jgi:hypothetical protein
MGRRFAAGAAGTVVDDGPKAGGRTRSEGVVSGCEPLTVGQGGWVEISRRVRVATAWAKDTGADLEKTNVNGGAIAIGHPLGASGARIMTTLVNALEQRGGRYGLQTMCEGGGMANSTIIERLGSAPSAKAETTTQIEPSRLCTWALA